MITLTPLSSSATSVSPDEPVSYFLELDDARILLDMGQRDYRASSEQTSWEYEEKIRDLAPTLSLVLLSHSPTQYLGLYAYARAHWGLKCPVYATQPTVEMGRVVSLAEAESWRAECPVSEGGEFRGPFVPTTEEIHEAFDHIKAIRYNQPLHLGGELSHLLLTPFPSGHVLGGTLFKIRSPTSGTVLYAVGINHTGERHLDGMVTGQLAYAEDIRRPDLLIVEGGRSTAINAKRRERETAILDLVSATLSSGRSVLMPCDASPRLLELLVLLDQHWSFKRTNPGGGGWNHPLCLVSRTAQDMVSFARSLIEWMGGVVRESGADDVVAALDRRKGRKRKALVNLGSEYGALDFSHVQFFATPEELLEKYPANRPKLVLAIPPTMSHGPSRALFASMASVPGNVILLTSYGEDRTLARELYSRWEATQPEEAHYGRGKIGSVTPLEGRLEIELDAKEPLSGEELEAYEAAEREKREREAAHQAALERNNRMLEADDLESDSDSDSEDGHGQEGANAFAGDGEDARTMSFDIFVKGQSVLRGTRFRMFPYIAKGRKVDSFGEGLDVGQWIRKGREIEEDGETEEVRAAKRRKAAEEERAKQAPEPPSKFVSSVVGVDLHASIAYVDMSGLHDGQAIRTIVADLAPRKLVVVKSTQEASGALKKYFEATPKITHDVFYPGPYQPIQIGEHVQSYSLQLGDSMGRLLAGRLSRFEGYEIAMVQGKLAYATGSTVPILEAADVTLPPLQAEVKVEEEADALRGKEAGTAQGGDTEKKAQPEAEQEKEAKAEKIAEERTEEAEAKNEPGAGATEGEEKMAAEEAAKAESGAEGTGEAVAETKGDGEDEVTEAPAAAASAETAADEAAEAKADAAAADGSAPGDTATATEEVQVKAEPIDVDDSEPTAEPTADPKLSLAARQAQAPASGPLPLPSSLFIGDLRLLALKNRLGSMGIPAQFAGEGVLVCGPGVQGEKGGIVAVRKLEEGRVVLEGPVSGIYFVVRKELYGSYAQVSA